MRQPTHPFATLKVEDDLLLPRVEVPHFKCLVFLGSHNYKRGAEIELIPEPGRSPTAATENVQRRADET